MARSSTHWEVCGNRSETSMPDWPYFAKVRLEPRITVSRNFPFWKSSLPKLSGGCWPCSFVQQGLRIVGVDLARAALHEERDDVLGRGGQGRLFGSERARALGGGAGPLEQVQGGEPADPHPGVLQELAARIDQST